MRERLERKIWEFIASYCGENQMENIWRRPVVRFADAQSPLFPKLRQVVTSEHHMPSEYLEGATVVVSYFLPFVERVGRSNVGGELASAEWVRAYLDTNAMAAEINLYLVQLFKREGVEACVPTDAGMIGPQTPKSRWSQRHVAYIAGHGSFGLNNMLISDKGGVGRYFSVVTRLNISPDRPVTEERCLYRKSGACGLCVKRCPAGALKETGFDRFRCLSRCMENDAVFGADVCGKCVVGLPCSFFE